MSQLTPPMIALALECTIGTASLYIGSTIYSNAIDALARVFG